MVNALSTAKDNAGLVLESAALDKLKFAAKQNSPESLKQAAQQFEALFMGILTKSMRAGGGEILKTYYCPHAPEISACDCRKPAPGMILQAARDFPDIDLAASFVVGDKATDITFARNAGCRGILVRTGYGEQVLAGEYQVLEAQPEKVCADITEAVAYILSQKQFSP